MLHFLTKTSLTLCIGSILYGTAIGQSTSTLRIGCTDIYKDQHTLYLRQVKGKKAEAQQVQLNVHSMNEPIQYKGGSTLSFFRTQDQAEDTENKSRPAAVCRLPASGAHFLLFIPSAAKSDKTKTDKRAFDYRILVIPSSDVAYGSFMLMNYSTYPLHASIDKTKGKILPGKHKVFHFPNGINNARTRMFIEPTQGKFQSIRSSKWSLAADTREFIILYNAPHSKGTLFKHIVDKKVTRKDLTENR